jgi:spore maturation protein CgeB
MGGRRVLLVTPAFHGYGGSIAGALRRRGHLVRHWAYDANPRAVDKLRVKVLHELPDRMGTTRGSRRRQRDLTADALRVLRSCAPDVVVTVKGDVLGDDYWSALDESGASQVLWLYDEVRRTRFRTSFLTTRPSLVSYSPRDVAALTAAGVRARHLADAFDHTIPFTPRPSGEVVFVGARYPERQRLLEALVAAGVPARAHGRDWSHHPVDRLRTWELSRPAVPAGRDLPRREAYGVTAGSVAALNSHTDQDGFTMRTYELPGTGALQLIDRPDVEALYEPGREVEVFGSSEELVELSHRAGRDRAWARRIGEAGRRRTLAEHTFDHRMTTLEDAWA